jgi:hypothetical protein
MKNKFLETAKALVDLFKEKEIKGDPVDTTPGIKISRTVNPDRKYSFNEISQSIFEETRKGLKVGNSAVKG